MIRRITLFALTLLTPLLLTAPAFAAQVDPFDEVCKTKPNATACQEKKAAVGDTGTRGDDANPIFGPDGIITKVINILSIVIGLAAVIAIMAAGMKFITSGSNPQQVTVAREMVLYAVVGLLVAAFAQLLVRFILDKI